MFKLLNNCIYFICQQNNAQNSLGQASTVCELRNSRCTELPDVQAGFRKGRGIRYQIANICWIIEKAREFQKSTYFYFIDYAKAFDCVDHNKLWKILQDIGLPDHLNCFLRNLYSGEVAIVRTEHGTTDWFQIEMEYVKAVYCHPTGYSAN